MTTNTPRIFAAALAAWLLLATPDVRAACSEGALLDQEFKRLAADESVRLCDTYADKVVLVVNTASKCGNTPQYEGLEKLYEEYGERGLVVLGFPSGSRCSRRSSCAATTRTRSTVRSRPRPARRRAGTSTST